MNGVSHASFITKMTAKLRPHIQRHMNREWSCKSPGILWRVTDALNDHSRLFDRKDEGNNILRKVGNRLRVRMMYSPRRIACSVTILWEQPILH